MNKILEYLKQKEWSMGNGQCPECCGVPPNWHGHPLHLTSETIGHRQSCTIAQMLTECGEAPLMIGDYRSPDVYEMYWSDQLLSTRIKPNKSIQPRCP